MLNPAILIGEPLDFKGKIKIYPLTIREVVTNPRFGYYLKVLTMTQEDLAHELQMENPPSPFEFLLANCYQYQQVAQVVQSAFCLFCHTKIAFLYNEKRIAILGTMEQIDENYDMSKVKFLEEEDFFDFQNALRQSVGDKPVKPPEPFDPDEDPRIRKIKAKARERDRIKARQGNKNGISLETCLVAICCMGIGLTPLNIGEMSYASVGEIMKMMQDKEKYDIDIRSLLAGADSKKVKPKYWIRNTND